MSIRTTSGLILDNNNELKEFQEFLNIMGIKCELVLKSLPDGQKELYFKHKKLVPFFETASSGTLSLINLYRQILIGRKSSMLYMDEFDAFYHYEMAKNVIRFFKIKYPECQIVMTTYNTNLMTNRIMRNRNLLIVEGNHEKNELISILLKVYPRIDIEMDDI